MGAPSGSLRLAAQLCAIIAFIILVTGWLHITPTASAATNRESRDCAAGWPIFPGNLDAGVFPETSVVGKALPFDWKLTSAGPSYRAAFEVPTYLVILTPDAVRFEGTGFFALAAGAKGPYGLKFGADRTRVIVPLHTRFSKTAGEVDIIPYRAGEMSVGWAIVQADSCGEHVSDISGKRTIEILPGPPQLVARNQFTEAKPEQEITPTKGPFRATVFQGFVEVRNIDTGEIVLQTTGHEPTFSPTGRFLSVVTDEAQISDVFDLLTERRIGRFQSVAMYWSHADSFLYLDQEWGADMQIIRTLHGTRESIESAPKVALLTSFREDGSPTPNEPLDGGIDANSEDIDPGALGLSFTAGSEAWRFDLSLEGGVMAFVGWSLMAHDYQEPGDVMDGLVIDLCRGNAMIKTSTRTELGATLASSFGVAKPLMVGWNAHETIKRSFDYYSSEAYRRMQEAEAAAGNSDGQRPDGEPATSDGTEEQPKSPIAFSAEPTQTSKAATPDQNVAGSADFRVRGAVPIAVASTPVVGADVGLGLDSGTEIRALRSGAPSKALNDIAREIAKFYDPKVVKFGKWPADEPLRYNTEPFPKPDQGVGDDGPILFDINLPGRDTWRWMANDKRYWLTQTVESGRLGHSFSFTLLGEDGRHLRMADLLEDKSVEADISDAEGSGASGLIQRGDLRTGLGAAFDRPSFVSIVDSRYLLLVTRPVVRLIAFDLKTWRPICIVSKPYNQAAIDRLALMEGARNIAQINKGGGVEVYSCSSPSRLLSGILTDGELVVTDGKGRFDGSPDASAYVELKIPGLPGRQLLSQFATQLRFPGLANAVIQGKNLGLPPDPVAPPSLQVSFDETGGRKTARIDASSLTGLRSLHVLADGRVVRNVPLDGKQAQVLLSPDEVGDSGIASVTAIDTAGLASAPIEFTLGASSEKSKGELLALAVGIDKYPAMPGSDLKYAASDARRVATTVGASAHYSGVKVETLLDEAATIDAIKAKLDDIVESAHARDTILLAFAGHGLLDARGRLRLALSSTATNAIEETSLDFDEIASRVAKAQARVIVLLDVCHAGASGQISVASNDDAVNLLTTRSGAGVVIISASKGRQFSEESSSIGGGRFSVAFQHALTDQLRKTDSDGNGRISVNELYAELKSLVAGQTSGRQIPWLSRNEIFGDFDLF
ncbi:caspase family protein [Mesorhizobium sp. INR15]|uniref:caspase family protein n=1 Tax=Mesorhizobium sp. INR15 TaxID=2654248 RepID=UPI0018967CD4|nr:caspase family protein [Mesorhizobium sp. INR15]QPC91603.1 CHAT domain-containing protein [Mesorhizobium sp. INR15]